MPEREMLETTRRLSERVQALAAHLEVSQAQARRTRRLTHMSLVLAAFVAVGMLVNVFLYSQVNEAVEANHHTAVIGCRNANESRAANLALWTFVLDRSATKPRSKADAKLAEDFRAWIGALFGQRDCADLDRRYTIPPPPRVGDR